MALKFSTKPKRITRDKALELARQARKYYKHDNSRLPFSVYLEEKMDNPNSYRVLVGREVDPSEHYDKGVARYKLSRLPTSEEYNSSKEKPTQKQIEEYIYVNGNHKLQEHTKDALHQEFRNYYLDRWANNGIEQPDIPTRVVFKSRENDEEDVIYQGALSDDIFVALSQWFDELQEMEELKNVSAQVIGDNDIRNEVADGNRKFRIAILGGVGEVFVKVGYNKFGEEINLNNYIY